jgi:hypothetical protein
MRGPQAVQGQMYRRVPEWARPRASRLSRSPTLILELRLARWAAWHAVHARRTPRAVLATGLFISRGW